MVYQVCCLNEDTTLDTQKLIFATIYFNIELIKSVLEINCHQAHFLLETKFIKSAMYLLQTVIVFDRMSALIILW